MRRMRSAALALCLTALLCTNALAAASARMVRAFVCDGTLYTYMTIDDALPTKAEARLGGRIFPASGRLETVRQAGSPVTWLLLVDNSNSMPAFRQEAETFVRSLAETGGEHTRFLLASFGDEFTVVREDVPAGELAAELAAIPMDEKVTRLHTAIGAALDYLEELPRERNELRCAVVLSDAVQYDPAGGIPYEELLERVGRSDVMLYSVGFGADREALERLGRLAEASGGIHRVVGEQSAQAAAAALAEQADALFVTGFDLSGYASQGGTEPVSVTLSAGGELLCRAQTEVELPELAGTPEPSPTQDPPELPEADPPETAPPEAAPEPAKAPEDREPADVWTVWPIAATAGAGILLAAAVGVLLHRKRHRTPPPAGEAPGGVYMRLEVVQGELAGGQTELECADELVLGSDPACAVALRGEGVSPRHARVFLSEGAVYLEDLQPPEGTQVNGETVCGPVRLRSGDEIRMGTAAVRLKF